MPTNPYANQDEALGNHALPTSSYQPTGATQPSSTLSPMQPTGSGNSITLPPATNLDPQVLAVAQTIKSIESQGNYNAVGDNGSSLGAYQWNNGKNPVAPGETPINWQNAAKQYLGSADAPMTPANQNYVAYQQVLAYKNKGLSPLSIDALWNGASPDPHNPGQYVHNSPQRAAQFQQALQQNAQSLPQTQTPAATPTTPTTPQSPSLGGFLSNVAGSAGNFLGNLATAIEHPVNTVENLANVPIGGLQELGGESTPQTQAFDALKSYFGNRYSSPQAIAHTVYTDPVGFAADLSTILGVGGGAVGAVGKVGELAGIGEASDLSKAAAAAKAAGTGADFVVNEVGTAASTAAPIRNAVQAAGDTLGKVAVNTNPLTPVIGGIGKALGLVSGPLASAVGSVSGLGGDAVKALWSGDTTVAQAADISRASVGDEVQAAIDAKLATLSETGSGYTPIKQITTPIAVDSDFLENQLRQEGKLDVVDGTIKPTTTSKVGTGEVSKLQDILNTFKPAFQKGELTPEEFLALRNRLDTAGYSEAGIKNGAVADIARGIRNNLNSTYRTQVQGLENLDNSFSAQKANLRELQDGLFYKTGPKKGQLMPVALSKIMSANKVGNDAQLAQLEKIIPGISDRIKAAAIAEKITTSIENHGGGLINSLLRTGDIPAAVAGAVTGNYQVVGGAIATTLLSNPSMVAKILEIFGHNKGLMASVVQHLGKVATLGAVMSSVDNQQQTQTPTSITPSITLPQSNTTQSPQSQPVSQAASESVSSQQDITQTPAYQAAITAGYTSQEIQQYLASQK